MADNFIVGKSGSVKIGAVSYSFDKWKVSFHAVLPVITNFTSGGYQALLSGLVDGTVTISGPYNNTNMGFTVGTTYTWLLNLTDAVGLSVPAIIESLEPDDAVADSPRISITAKSTGSFTAAIL